MFTLRRLIATLALTLSLLASAFAQQTASDNTNQRAAASTSIITATATRERVRFSAPNSTVQMRLEVYDEFGRKVFDTEQHGGSVLDWHLKSGDGEHVAEGTYLCVVTVKNLSGHLSQKLGKTSVSAEQVSMQGVGATELNAQQTQAIGPVEKNSSLIILQSDEPLAVTVIAHDGRDGQVTRTRGALSFRVGDFFSGTDQEQMRLTEEGNLGLGTSNPQAKLDVAGTIRASGSLKVEKGIEFSDGTVQTTGLSGRKDKDGNIVPATSGSGTQDKIAKWLDNAGTLGDSIITESGSNIGIGTTTPLKRLHVAGGQLALDNTRFLYSRRTNGQFQEAFGIDNNDDIVFNRNSIVAGVDADAPKASSALIFGTGAGRFMDVRNSANVTLMRVQEANGFVGIRTSNPQAPLQVAGNVMFDGLRTESNATSPNVIGGYSGNSVGTITFGATISGGGNPVGFNGPLPNKVMGHYGTVGGGYGNIASGGVSTISGGASNTAIGEYAAIGGGLVNTANGSFATVGGGFGNSADGDFSLAAGARAKISDTAIGTFAWADSTVANFNVTTPDQFAIRAANGLFLAVDAGAAKTVQVGERYRDNAIVAWSGVNSDGTLNPAGFGIATIEHTGTGIYTITVTATAASAGLLAPVAIAEMDIAPTSTATLRIVSINQQLTNKFQVFINNGNGTPVDNQFVFMATAR